MRGAASLLALVLIGTAAGAQVRPMAGPGDPHIQSVAYDANQVVQLQVASGYQLSIEFAPDERIENIAIGDSAAWQVTPNKRGDHLFIKAAAMGVTTNLTVVTDARSYSFELLPLYGPTPDMSYIVRFTYPAAAIAKVETALAPGEGRYKLGGSKALRPAAINDDGAKTYIEFAPDRPLPAVFGYDERGREVLAQGAMRDGQYVIDSVLPKLLFRIDKHTASAARVRVRN